VRSLYEKRNSLFFKDGSYLLGGARCSACDHFVDPQAAGTRNGDANGDNARSDIRDPVDVSRSFEQIRQTAYGSRRGGFYKRFQGLPRAFRKL
jgi:hypothetical protein